MPATLMDLDAAIPLQSVRPGDAGRLVVQGAANATIQRLMAMGLMPGTFVKVIRVAPLGDPIVLETHGFQVSLRKREAHGLAIEAGARAGLRD
jgi:ferrous iron transport protein A